MRFCFFVFGWLGWFEVVGEVRGLGGVDVGNYLGFLHFFGFWLPLITRICTKGLV